MLFALHVSTINNVKFVFLGSLGKCPLRVVEAFFPRRYHRQFSSSALSEVFQTVFFGLEFGILARRLVRLLRLIF